MRRILLLAFLSTTIRAALPAQDTVNIRGQQQELHLYGARGGTPVILSSGDLGWAGLVVQVAEYLESRGCYVVGFNSRSYLAGFTGKKGTLAPKDVPEDYGVLIQYAAQGSAEKPILAGISEGAGLSVLTATRQELKGSILGILAIGLPDQTELGWKWQDATIWITKKAPDEPSFLVSGIISLVSPVPLAEIHSSHDEFLAIDKAKAMFGLAGEPKRMWIIEASNHRFSGNRPELFARIIEALEWIRSARH